MARPAWPSREIVRCHDQKSTATLPVRDNGQNPVLQDLRPKSAGLSVNRAVARRALGCRRSDSTICCSMICIAARLLQRNPMSPIIRVADRLGTVFRLDAAWKSKREPVGTLLKTNAGDQPRIPGASKW